MSNIRFLYTFDFDSATITSSSEASGFADDNVAHVNVKKTWRSTGDTAEWLKFDLGSAQNIKEVALLNHNLTSGATITLEANATDSWGAPSHSSAFTWKTAKIVKFLDETYRWWRVTFADAANPDAYIAMGRICAGVYVTPSRNITERHIKAPIDPSIIQEYGSPYALKRKKYWEYRVRFKEISRADQDILTAMYDTIGVTEPVVVSLDPDTYPSVDSIYARMLRAMPIQGRIMTFADMELAFKELV